MRWRQAKKHYRQVWVRAHCKVPAKKRHLEKMAPLHWNRILRLMPRLITEDRFTLEDVKSELRRLWPTRSRP